MPQADDVALVIEVADTSVASDRQVSGALHAAFSVPETWIDEIPTGQPVGRFGEQLPQGGLGVKRRRYSNVSGSEPRLAEQSLGQTRRVVSWHGRDARATTKTRVFSVAAV